MVANTTRLFALALVLGTCKATSYSEVEIYTHFEPVLDFSMVELVQSSQPLSVQPFGDHLFFSFRSFNRTFESELVVHHHTFAPDATFDVYDHVDGNSVLRKSIKPDTRSYHSPEGSPLQVSAYVYGLDHIHAVIVADNEVYNLDPVGHHERSHAHPSVLLRGGELSDEASQMVIVRESDVKGALAGIQRKLVDTVGEEFLSRKLQSPAEEYPEWNGVYWGNCWPGQEESPKAIVVGIAVDVGYFQAAGNTEEAVLTDVSILVNDATKHIYAPQMNVYISIGPTDVRSTLGGPSWNRSPPCGLSAQSALGDFRTFRSSQHPNDAGVWHLLTDCFPPPGTVGIAYVGVICSRGSGAGLTTYMGGNTWKTFAHELGHNFNAGHSFEEQQGRTGGIMDYGNGRLDGEYQFNTKYRKEEVCREISTSMTSIGGRSNVCWIVGKGNGGLAMVYDWQASNTQYNACSKPCGSGIQVSEVLCIGTFNGTETTVTNTFCDPKTRPDGLERVCNTNSCSAFPEKCNSCIPGFNCCTQECRQIAPQFCRAPEYQRDGMWARRGATRIFAMRDSVYAQYSDVDKGRVMGASFPRFISTGFDSLDPSFQRGVDAAATNQDGDVFLFKGSRFVRYSLGAGQNSGYPKTIAEGYRGMSFTSGVDAAVSFLGGVYFFKGDQYELYLDGQQTQQPGYPKALGQWEISFKDYIDAAVYHWESGLIDFYRNGYQLRYQLGIGEIEAPKPATSIGEPGAALACPNNCDECAFSNSKNRTVCTLCVQDFKASKSKPGTCTPYIYAMDLPFDDRTYDLTLIKENNVPPSAWVRNGGNVGGGISLNPGHFLELNPLGYTFPQFSYHVFVKLNSASQSMNLVSMEFSNGMKGSWVLAFDPLETRGLLSKFTLGDAEVTSETPVVPGLWKHIHADLIGGNLRVSVDAVETRIPFQGIAFGEEFKITKWRIGSAYNNGIPGLDASLDMFHIDTLEVTEEQALANALPASTASLATAMVFSILLAVGLLILLHYYVSTYRLQNQSDGKTRKRDLGVVAAMLLLAFFFFILPALVGDGDIQFAFQVPMTVIFVGAVVILLYLIRQNNNKWLWSSGDKNDGETFKQTGPYASAAI